MSLKYPVFKCKIDVLFIRKMCIILQILKPKTKCKFKLIKFNNFMALNQCNFHLLSFSRVPIILLNSKIDPLKIDIVSYYCNLYKYITEYNVPFIECKKWKNYNYKLL